MTSTTPLPGSRREAKTNSLLIEKLASVLPKGYKFGIYHLSTPPTRTDALYSAPPDDRPDKTYREDHLLAISIDAEPPATKRSDEEAPGPAAVDLEEQNKEPGRVLVLALEVFIFTTAFSTTLFVSKADSTGYLHLLHLPKGTPSPIREISAAFVSFLIEHRQRKDVQSVVSLFARAQSQYLFPGSEDNKSKHVLDDRGLVKWWCRVLNPLLEPPDDRTRHQRQEKWVDTKGYLIVPGLDHYETRAFLPRSSQALQNWTLGHPLEIISHYTGEYDWVPLRCLIPKYPDDPKSRFRDELDEEAAKWKQDTGSWKSVKTLAQFWEMMAFRQECSSGRLTGFIWVVLDPKTSRDSAPLAATGPPLLTPSVSFDAEHSVPPPSTPSRQRVGITASTPRSTPKKLVPASTDSTPSKRKPDEEVKKKKAKKLRGVIISRQPHIKTHQRNYLLDRPTSTAFYYWPPEGRGERIVDETSYKRIVELLLHLDFATLEKARGSTGRWISEVGVGVKWGRDIVGTGELAALNTTSTHPGSTAGVTNLSGLVKRKRLDNASCATDSALSVSASSQPSATVNVLGAGLVRKKRKDEVLGLPSGDTQSSRGPDASGDENTAPGAVNVLGAGLVRKNPKVPSQDSC